MFNIGPMELILILIVALIIFGPAKLPEIGNALGKMLREFKKASDDLTQEFTKELYSEAEQRPGSGEQAASTSEEAKSMEQSEGSEKPGGLEEDSGSFEEKPLAG